MSDTITFLRTVPLFSEADEKALAACLPPDACRTVAFAEGETIRTGRALAVLAEGRAQIFSADRDRPVILRTILPQDVFGAAGLFASGDLPLSRICAETACRCLFLPSDAVRALLRCDAHFLDRYLAFLSDRVRFLHGKILCFTAGSADRRLALWLLSEERDTVTLPLPAASFADMLGIGRASLYRAFDKLEHAGFIRRSGRTITLRDRGALIEAYTSK